MINNSIIFSLRYCMYLRAPLSSLSSKLERTKTIFEAKQQDIFLYRILKKGLDENLDDFLKTAQKISNKKKLLINASKQKQNMDK